jgi:hypothetical protein
MRHFELHAHVPSLYIILYTCYTVHLSSYVIHLTPSGHKPTHVRARTHPACRYKPSMSAADIPNEPTLRREVQHAGLWMSIMPSMSARRQTERGFLES